MKIALITAFMLIGIQLPMMAQTTAQTDRNDQPNSSSRLLVHYTVDELDEMQINFPEKYAAVRYYHLKSYIVEPLEGFDLTVDLNTFDISPFERYRHQTETVVKTDWKKGIRITFIPVQDLEYKLPIHLAPQPSTEDED